MNPQYVALHVGDDSTRITYRILKTDLLIVKDEHEIEQIQIMVQAILYKSYETAHIIDSTTVKIKLTNTALLNDPYISGSLTLKTESSTYVVELNFMDINRKQTDKSFLWIDKSSVHTQQNFMVLNHHSGEPIFDYTILPNESFSVQNQRAGNGKVVVRYYGRQFPLAIPPFSLDNPKPLDYKADSTFTIELGNDQSFQFTKKGIYHFQSDTTGRQGLTLFIFDSGYPELTDTKQLLEPLRYLTTRREYEALTKEPDSKKAVDEYWLSLAGNQDRGRELIRKYYTRVEEANKLFTSYHEGWKTDRGLIYIIFGSPNIVYKSSTTESWIYGEVKNVLSVTFNFTKTQNPFTDNDYSLIRSPSYETTWYTAVDVWRQGRVFKED